MILDEIQTGLGRNGKLLAEEHEGVEADVTRIGKELSGWFFRYLRSYPIPTLWEATTRRTWFHFWR